MRGSNHFRDENHARQARPAAHPSKPAELDQYSATGGTRPQRRRARDPRQVALRLLAIRSRTIVELSERLTKTGAPADKIQTVIEELIRERFLDDAAFARELTESVLRRKPVGPRFLRARLMRYGVPEHIVRETLSILVPPEREQELAKDAARRKLRVSGGARMKKTSDERRVLAYLLRRGFSSTVAFAAIHDVLPASGRGTMNVEA